MELAKRLVACSFVDCVFFSNSGTEANEAAIKFAGKFQRFSHPDEKQAATELIQCGNTAAVFVEPIQGEGGIYSATKEFLYSLHRACDDFGSHLVFEEVSSCSF